LITPSARARSSVSCVRCSSLRSSPCIASNRRNAAWPHFRYFSIPGRGCCSGFGRWDPESRGLSL
jgi:hypothetical protein